MTPAFHFPWKHVTKNSVVWLNFNNGVASTWYFFLSLSGWFAGQNPTFVKFLSSLLMLSWVFEEHFLPRTVWLHPDKLYMVPVHPVRLAATVDATTAAALVAFWVSRSKATVALLTSVSFPRHITISMGISTTSSPAKYPKNVVTMETHGEGADREVAKSGTQTMTHKTENDLEMPFKSNQRLLKHTSELYPLELNFSIYQQLKQWWDRQWHHQRGHWQQWRPCRWHDEAPWVPGLPAWCQWNSGWRNHTGHRSQSSQILAASRTQTNRQATPYLMRKTGGISCIKEKDFSFLLDFS